MCNHGFVFAERGRISTQRNSKGVYPGYQNCHMTLYNNNSFCVSIFCIFQPKDSQIFEKVEGSNLIYYWLFEGVTSFEFFKNTHSWQCWHYCQLCTPIYLQFPPLFDYYDLSYCEIRFEGIQETYILRFHISLVCFISHGTAKTKLTSLAFMCWLEIVKNSN